HSLAMRDSQATKAKILRAAGALLARAGFGAVGVSAIADEAGVGKPLIYRYFGGLDGLLDAFGKAEDFWPHAEELLAVEPGARPERIRGRPARRRGELGSHREGHRAPGPSFLPLSLFF